jgi:superfamily II DNA/RNA helicase
MKQLIENNAFNPESVRLFVLDEADKLMEQDFQENIKLAFFY